MFRREHRWVSLNLIPVIGTVKEVSNITRNPNMHNFMVKFWIKNIVGNLLLLFPLEVLLPLLWEKFRNFTRVIIFALSLTLSIEILQLLSGYIGNIGRAFDIDDIILNTAGALIGFIVYNIFNKTIKPTNLKD
jgi:Glycopeptide antibiotics resistance protein